MDQILELLKNPYVVSAAKGAVLAILGNLKRDVAAFKTYREAVDPVTGVLLHPDAKFDVKVALRHAGYAAVVGILGGIGLQGLAPAVGDILNLL